MTKPVTVAAAMTLVEEGKLALDRPGREVAARAVRTCGWSADIRRPAGRRRSPRGDRSPFDDLMTHRSGLAYAFSVPGPLARAYGKLSLRQDQDGWLAELAKLPLAHQPGDAADLQPRHRRARHRAVPDRGQAAVARSWPSASSTRSACPTPVSSSSADRAAARRHDVPARRKRHAAPRRDGPRADLRSAVLHAAGRGCGRPPTTTCGSPGCCWPAAALDGVRVLSEESVPADAHRPADRRAEAVSVPRDAVLDRPRVRPEPVGGHRPARSPGSCSVPAGSARSAGPAPTAPGGRPIRRRT